MSSPAEIVISSDNTPSTIGLFVGQPGQSLYDICIQTYGTLDLFFMLLMENKIVSASYTSVAGVPFTFDKTKIIDNAIFSRNTIDNIVYSTMYAPPKGIFADDKELREDLNIELREDGGIELR